MIHTAPVLVVNFLGHFTRIDSDRTPARLGSNLANVLTGVLTFGGPLGPAGMRATICTLVVYETGRNLGPSETPSGPL
jgi:hypothetical protein